MIGISGTISALMVPAHNLRDALPREMDLGDDLVSDYGVVAHLAKFGWLESAALAENVLVYAYLANIVQITRGTQLAHVFGAHAQRFCDACGIASHTQGVATLINVFH